MKRAVGALFMCSLFKTTGSFASAGEKEARLDVLNIRIRLQPWSPPLTTTSAIKREGKKTPQGSHGVFSYYGNHQLTGVAAHRVEDAKNAE